MARKTTLPLGATSRRESVDTALKNTNANFGELYGAQNGSPVVVVGNTPVTPDGVAHIHVQINDLTGAPLAVRAPVKLFFSATSYGAPTDLGTVGDVTTGVAVSSSDTVVDLITDATGLAVLSYAMAANGNLFVHAQSGGKLGVGNVAVTGHA